jgi:uncharacterized protein YndB with AHSA1/START domain
MLRVAADDVIIERPADEVFDQLADGRLYADWLPGASDMELATAEPVGVGSRFRGKFPGFGEVRWQIERYERPRRLVNLGAAPIGDMRHILTFEPVPGGTRLAQRGEGTYTGIFRVLGPIAAPFIRAMIAKNWRQTALHLKTHLEGTSPIPTGKQVSQS